MQEPEDIYWAGIGSNEWPQLLLAETPMNLSWLCVKFFSVLQLHVILSRFYSDCLLQGSTIGSEVLILLYALLWVFSIEHCTAPR